MGDSSMVYDTYVGEKRATSLRIGCDFSSYITVSYTHNTWSSLYSSFIPYGGRYPVPAPRS